jgi:hypothetical protein
MASTPPPAPPHSALDTTPPPNTTMATEPLPPPPLRTPSTGLYKHPRHREAYHLTQLGVAANVRSLDKLLDEHDPDSGFGVKPGGPQGFMVYCKDLETMTALPAIPAALLGLYRHSHGPTRSISLHSPPESPALPIVRSESVPVDSSSPHSRQSSPAPFGHHSQGSHTPSHSSTGPHGKAFHHLRGSDKINNRKSTPEFDRKNNTTGSNDGSMKSKKSNKGKAGRKKSDNERLARKEEKRRRAHGPPIVIKTLEDFPEEALKLIRKTKIPDQQLLDHLSVIVRILSFR